MFKTKLLASILLIATVLFAQVGIVAAAPLTQDSTPITGTIQSITTETDASGLTTVLVTLLDDQGATQTVRLSVDTAVALGLVTVDPITNEVVVDETQVNQPVEIDLATVIPDQPTEEESVHPIAALLAAFFGEEPAIVDAYHDDGFGFGVIAQAMWMSGKLGDDASLTGLILEAKKSGDYSAFTLPDGSSPTNWGQFKKALSDKKNNLGVIVSGHANQDDATDSSTQQIHGNGNNNGHGHGKGKDKNKP